MKIRRRKKFDNNTNYTKKVQNQQFVILYYYLIILFDILYRICRSWQGSKHILVYTYVPYTRYICFLCFHWVWLHFYYYNYNSFYEYYYLYWDNNPPSLTPSLLYYWRQPQKMYHTYVIPTYYYVFL